jgi:tetratricopeptide (TPR) repeat protein
LADEEKKGAGSGGSGDKSSETSEFKDIGSIGVSDWEGALDEWDDTFEGLDDIAEPPQTAKPPGDASEATTEAKTEAKTEAEKQAETEAAEEAEVDALTATLGRAPKLAASPADTDADAVSDADADAVSDAEVDADADRQPVVNESTKEKKDDALDFLSSGKFELEMESGEALGEMLSSEMDAEASSAAAIRPSPDGLEDLAPEAMENQADEAEDKVEDEAEKAAEVEEAAEVTLTVDDEFYDDFSLKDGQDAPAPDLDFGFGPADGALDEPLSDDVTPERPHLVVPPDAHRDDEDASPVPDEGPSSAESDPGSTPIPQAKSAAPADMEMADALDSLADMEETLAPHEPQPETPLEAEEPGEDDAAVELSFEAEEPGEFGEDDAAAVELSFEAEEPGVETPTPDEDPSDEDPSDEDPSDEDPSDEDPSDEDEGLSSLDAMLGLRKDSPEEAVDQEPESGGGLASLDALLGIADPSVTTHSAAVAPVLASSENERVTDFGFDLPEPPAESQLTNLQSMADQESHPSALPPIEAVDPLRESPVIEGFPETLAPEPQSAELWEEVVALISGRVEEAESSSVEASLETAAGALLEFRLERPEDAMARYYEASTKHPEHRGCRRALLRCGVGAGDWGAALESCEVLRESSSNAERRAYGALTADLALATMGDSARAAELYTALLDHPTGSLFGLLGLLDVAVFNGDQELLASTLRRLVDAIDSEVIVAPVALEAGRRLEVREEDEAAAVVYERATGANNELASSAREGLVRLAVRGEQWETAAQRLRDLVTQIEPGDQRTDTAVALTRILSRRLDRLDEAVVTATGAAQEAPHGLAVQIRLARLCQEAGQWEEAIAAWKGASEAARDDHLKAVTQLWAGLLMEQNKGDADSPLECFRAATELDPNLVVASLAVGDVLGRSDDVDGRVEARIARASAVASPADQAGQQVLAAREMVAADRAPEGLQLLASARASGLDFRGLLRDLVQLSISQGDTDQACDVLLQIGERAEPEEAIAVRSRAASLVARSLEEERQNPYREVYELDASLAHLAWGAQRALRAAGRTQDWDSALAAEAELTSDGSRGARLWHHLGNSRRWQGQPQSEAIAAFERAAALSSDDAASREAMAALYASQKRWEDCARLLGESGEAATVFTQEALVGLRRAVCLEQRLDAPDQAATLYQELGEQFPSWPLPLDTLVRLRVWSGDRLKTAEILETQAAQGGSDAQRVPLLIRASAELDAGGDSEAAARVLGKAIALAPDNPMASIPFEQLQNELGNWAAMADQALSIAKDTEDAAARLTAYLELARIDRDGRADFPSAVLGYESIVRMAPEHHCSLRELELYYPAEQRFNDLGSICAKIAGATEGPERAANALEWARYRPESSQREELVEALRTAVSADPKSMFALARLEGHALREGWRDELALIHRAVADLYRGSPAAQAVFLRRAAESHEAAGVPEQAVDALTEAIGVAPDYLPAAEAWLRLELLSERWTGVVDGAIALARALRRPEAKAEAFELAGVVAEERLEDSERAVAAFEAVLELQSDNRLAFGRLRNLYEQRQAWSDLARILNARLEEVDSAAATCELLWELAQVERDRLDDSDSAKVTLKRLIGLDENHLEGVRAATELYAADEQWVEVAGMLIRQARLEKAPEKLSKIFFRLGVLYDEKIPDAKRATASFSKVVQINQRDIGALERLSAIHVKNEEWKGALAVTGRLVETESDPERRIDHLITLSQILEGGYRDPRRAREALLKAVEMDPRGLRAVGELATFYGRQNDRRSLMVHLDRSVTNIRTQLAADPFNSEAYQSLLKLFEWRRAPDQQACAAAALTAIGEAGDREREILATMGQSRPRWDGMKDPELDEILFPTSINSGFRHTMRLLGGFLGKLYRDDLSTYGARRGTRVPKSGHPLRDVANQIGSELGVSGFDLHVVTDRPGVLVVEPYDPPAIIVGSALVEGATPAELAFIVGRCMKLIQANMVLGAKLKPEQLQSLVAGIVRQYQPDFEPTDVPPAQLLERTKLVAKATPRKVKSELMPFALGCAGITDYAQLSRDIARVANMSGLLACGDLGAAVAVLLRMAGKTPGKKPLRKLAKGLVELEQLLQFAVSEEYFDLRRRVGLASGSGPRF